MDTSKKLPEKQEQIVMPVKVQVAALLTQAIDKNVSVDTMERLLIMWREVKAEYAKARFDTAMAQFQAECPTIKKTKVVFTNAGEKAYCFAPLESIIAQVKEPLKKHGFSYAIQTETKATTVKATCIAKHIDGHSEPSSFEVPLGNKTTIMSQTQVVAAALTFAKRYAFCNAFGIMTEDEDTDATSAPSGKPEEQKHNATKGGEARRTRNIVTEKQCPVCHAPKNKVHATNCRHS